MIVIVMGVSGCGKSTIASKIAKQLDAVFLDADDLHPAENKDLMSRGIALSDENRWPWLHTVRDTAMQHRSANHACIIACSALKKSYRDILNEVPNVCYLFLHGPRDLIQQRRQTRTGHFMAESLLDSQISTLESPLNEPNVIPIDIHSSPDEITDIAIKALKQAQFM